MKFGYYVLGFIVFWIVEFLSLNVGNALGSGPAEAGIIVSAISALCSIVIICTLIIVDAIKNITVPGHSLEDDLPQMSKINN